MISEMRENERLKTRTGHKTMSWPERYAPLTQWNASSDLQIFKNILKFPKRSIDKRHSLVASTSVRGLFWNAKICSIHVHCLPGATFAWQWSRQEEQPQVTRRAFGEPESSARRGSSLFNNEAIRSTNIFNVNLVQRSVARLNCISHIGTGPSD